jgi:MEDS: MEthanogen/methylotroph, DcmR Sensory domain
MSDTSPTVSFGFVEQRFPIGGHICYIYTDEAERREVMTKFVESGFASDEKVVYFADRPRTGPAGADRYLSAMNVSVPRALRPGQFVLGDAEPAYCPDGTFEPERMIETWRALYRRSLDEGFPRVRVTGETSWLRPSLPGADRWFEYEAILNNATEELSFTAIVCQYNANLMDGAALYNVLNVHPMMIVRRQLVHNPYYEPPDRFLARTRPKGAGHR